MSRSTPQLVATPDDRLNPGQQAAVASTSNRLVLVAGPGSGKTHTLIQCIVAAIASGVPAREIVVLTFTNAAAREILDRLARLGIDRLGYVGTLHGWCFRILQQHGGLIGYLPGSIAIVTEEAREALIVEIIGRLGYTKTFSRRHIDNPKTREHQLVYRELRHTLKRHNMVDYDHILNDALELLKIGSVRDGLRIARLYVDEAQDSGAIDWAIYDRIPADRRAVIGDPDQSMYGFRGARPELFDAEARGKAEIIRLEWNYRSDRDICAAGNALIAHNPNRLPKVITTTTGLKGLVHRREYEDASEERYEIGRLVEAKALKDFGTETDWSRVAVLCRTNWLAAEIRESLLARGIPLAAPETIELPRDWPLALASVTLMLNPGNDLVAEHWLKARGIPVKAINTAKMEAMRRHIPVIAIPGIDYPTYAEGRNLATLRRFVSPESLALIEQRSAILGGAPSLVDLLHDLWKSDQWGTTKQSAGVTVCTIHAAKGREWDHVIVAGMEEGLCPLKSGEIEEERRIAFVAVTRARHSLTLTRALSRTRFFKTTAQEPSRFLAEIPESHES